MTTSTMAELVIEFNEIIDALNDLENTNRPNIKRFATKDDGCRRIKEVYAFLKKLKKDEVELKYRGRKQQVYAILCNGSSTTKILSHTLGISRRNISSILTYLRQEGELVETSMVKKECYIKLIT